MKLFPHRIVARAAVVLLSLGAISVQAIEIPFFGVHRGGAAWRPEHTIDTYREVLRQWPDAMLECDARLTKDGVVVLHHDETVDRTTEGSGPIAALTIDEVKSLDAGHDFSPDGGMTFPYRGKGLTIATLDEFLETFPSSPILIEPKNQPGIVEAVTEIVRKHNAEDRVLIASFQPETMEAVKRSMPDVKTCFSMTTGMRLMDAMRGKTWADYTPEDDVLAMGIGMLERFQITPEEIGKMREKGIAVQLYDVDSKETMNTALALGVDGVLTDRPDLLAEVLAEQPASPPATR